LWPNVKKKILDLLCFKKVLSFLQTNFDYLLSYSLSAFVKLFQVISFSTILPANHSTKAKFIKKTKRSVK